MRIAFLIMAHKDPPQIERLIRRLQHPDSYFFIHLDAKIDITPFRYLEQMPQVYFTQNRISVRWAAFSFTRSIYTCLDEVLQREKEIGFVQVMSAQDYPVVSTEEIHTFYTKHAGNNFISCEKEGSDWWKHAIGRISNYHFIDYPFPGRYRVQALVNAIMPKRKFPLPYVLYGGPRASWFTVNRACAEYLTTFMKTHPELVRFCRFTWGSDEFLFQTLIMNSPFADTVQNDVINYIDWSGGGANPKLLTTDDYQAMKDSGKLFARKFDFKVDTRILDMLDS